MPDGGYLQFASRTELLAKFVNCSRRRVKLASSKGADQLSNAVYSDDMLSKQQHRQPLNPGAVGDAAAELWRNDKLTLFVGMDAYFCHDSKSLYVDYMSHNIVAAIVFTYMHNAMDDILVI